MQNIRTTASNGVTFLAALIPVFKSCPPCPICMPKYAALFAFFGLELADYSQYLIPLILVSMMISLSSMYSQILKNNLTSIPFYIASISSVILLASKFYFDNSMLSIIAMAGIFYAIFSHYANLRKVSCNC
ncbi:MAG: hypothetical protein P8L77_03530 [Gammaproteobacteria bacterium]|nr:hypothetical protein [Gammaproteobacteria bacterium]